MKFEKKDDNVHVAFVTCQQRSAYGKAMKVHTAVRAIRERSGNWRADKTVAVAGSWMPWEPVVSTEFRTLTAAKTALRSFAKACRVYKPDPYGMGRARGRR